MGWVGRFSAYHFAGFDGSTWTASGDAFWGYPDSQRVGGWEVSW